VPAIAAGRAVSFLGDEVALLAIAFRAKAELGHLGVAGVLVAGAAPLVLLAPVAGLVVDRLRTRGLLIAVTMLQAALCAALAWSSSAMLIPLVVLLACGTAIATPAWQALVPALVETEQLPAAVGMLQSWTALAGMAGPFVGGLLVAYFGFHVPLLVDAASFVLLAAVPLLLRVDRVPAGGDGGGISLRDATAGIRLIAHSAVLRSLLVLASLFVLALSVINVAEIYFVTGALHSGPRGYGLLGLSFGFGMLVTAGASGRIAQRFERPERLFVAGCAVLCASVLLLAFTHSLWQAAALVVLMGAGNALVNVNAMVLFTTNSTDDVRGRVFAAIQGVLGAFQIGAIAIGGLLLTVLAPRTIMVGAAVASMVVLACTVAPVLRAGGDGSTQEEGRLAPARA
jgi:MFS family permease